jgi:hypothetical protein
MGRPIKPYCKEYSAQKQNARRRGISFEFNYDTWIEWWGADIVNRGKGKDKLVMARNNDIGAYHPNNVVKMLNQENVRQGNIGRIFSEDTCKKLSIASYERWTKEKENI